MAAPPPTSTASSPPAMWSTTSTGRPSRPPAWAAWPPSTRSVGCRMRRMRPTTGPAPRRSGLPEREPGGAPPAPADAEQGLPEQHARLDLDRLVDDAAHERVVLGPVVVDPDHILHAPKLARCD